MVPESGLPRNHSNWSPLSEGMACYSISQVEKLSLLSTNILAKFIKPERGGVERGLGSCLSLPRHLDMTEHEVFTCSFAHARVLFSVQLYFPQKVIGLSISCFPHNADSLNTTFFKDNIRAELMWADLS